MPPTESTSMSSGRSIGVAPSMADKAQSTITWTAKFDAKDKPEADAKAVIDGIFKSNEIGHEVEINIPEI